MTGPDLRRFPTDLPHLREVVTEMDWTGAACRAPDVPTWLFFPSQGDAETSRAAKAVCATCPADVKARCLAWAMEHREPGIWGGTSDRERRALRGWTPGGQTDAHGYTKYLTGCRCAVCKAAKAHHSAVARLRRREAAS